VIPHENEMFRNVSIYSPTKTEYFLETDGCSVGRNYMPFMESEVSLLCPQDPSLDLP
jgi:hypothetical protein